MTRTESGWRSVVIFCLLAFAVIGTPGAQGGRSSSFEVASVRLSDPGPVFSQITNSRLTLTKFPLRQVLWMAFRLGPLQSEQIVVPDWARDVRVDIQANYPKGSREFIPEMLQTLLADRFGLRTSMKSRPTDVYELVTGGGGIRMSEVQAANELEKKFETAPLSGPSDRVIEEIGGAVRVTNTPQGLRITSERSTYERKYTTKRATFILDVARLTMAEFASLLTGNVGRPVFDRTGLTGLYQFQIELPLDASTTNIVASLGTARGGLLSDPSGVSALKAVEQLGLKLEPRRIPIDIIVVDSLNKVPTEN